MERIDTFVVFATAPISLTLSETGLGLTVIPISTAFASGLTLTKKTLYDIILNKYIDHDYFYVKTQQINNFLMNSMENDFKMM